MYPGKTALTRRLLKPARPECRAGGHDRQHIVIAAERCGLGVFRPVRLEGDLRHLAGFSPAGGDTFGAFRRAAVQQYHVGMLGVRLVELCPDPLVIIVVHAAGEGDLGAGGDQHLGLGAATGGEEVPAIDHRRRHVGVADLRAGARPPGRSGLRLEQVGGIVAHELEGVAAFQQRDALGDEALELDTLDLRAVLLALAGALRFLVAVELALDALAGAMEEIGDRPEQVFEIGLQAGVAENFGEGVEDRGDR